MDIFLTPESLKFVCRWLLGKPTRSEDYTKDKNPCTPDGFSVMHLAAANGKTNVMKILIRNAENKTLQLLEMAGHHCTLPLSLHN